MDDTQKIRFRCPVCPRRMRASIELAGMPGECPDCGTIVTIPIPAGTKIVPQETKADKGMVAALVAVLALVVVGVGVFLSLQDSKSGSGGSPASGGAVQERTYYIYRRCTCGCKHSETMIAELQQQGGPAAISAIEEALAEIAKRERHGLTTEEMIVHRCRLLHLAKQIQAGKASEQRGPAAGDLPLGSNIQDCYAEQER